MFNRLLPRPESRLSVRGRIKHFIMILVFPCRMNRKKISVLDMKNHIGGSKSLGSYLLFTLAGALPDFVDTDFLGDEGLLEGLRLEGESRSGIVTACSTGIVAIAFSSGRVRTESYATSRFSPSLELDLEISACFPSLATFFANPLVRIFPASFFFCGDAGILYLEFPCFCANRVDFRTRKGSSSARALRLFGGCRMGIPLVQRHDFLCHSSLTQRFGPASLLLQLSSLTLS